MSEAVLSKSSTACSLQSVAILRLALGLTILLGTIIFLEGTSWDIQWHSYIGRDRTLIPPHIMMLSGVALSGFSSLLIVLIESLWSRHNQSIAQYGSRFAEIFTAPPGAYIVGYAALLAAVAFPLDTYWHTLYGIDVAIWAPFHIMFFASMGIAALGAVYVLNSAAHLADRASAPAIQRAAALGVVLALATFLGLFTLLLFDALDRRHTLDLGFMRISFFPLLSGTLVAFTMVAAASMIPWRWAATYVGILYLCLAGIMAMFVQPATDLLLGIEHLSYRAHPPFTSILALEWFIAPLIVAILIDVARQQLSGKLLALFQSCGALLSGALPIMFVYPLFPIMPILQLGVAGFLVSLLLGLGGAYLGTLFGQNVGAIISSPER